MNNQLPKEQFEKSLDYVCYERNYFYLLEVKNKIKIYPLFYLDRFWGWDYSDGIEGILPAENGLEKYMESNALNVYEIIPEQFVEKIELAIRGGQYVAVTMRMEHRDGTSYNTSVLIENIDDHNLYFTKTNETWNKIKAPIPIDEAMDRMMVSEGFVTLKTISIDDSFKKFREMNDLDAYKYICCDLYGTTFNGGQLCSVNRTKEVTLLGLEKFIQELKGVKSEIQNKKKVSKFLQFRLNKHVQNKIMPIVNCNKYILESEALSELLSNELKRSVESDHQKIVAELNQLSKYFGLMVLKPEERFFCMYEKQIKELREVLSGYLQRSYEIQRQILIEGGINEN